jgi:cytochrome P450 family 135
MEIVACVGLGEPSNALLQFRGFGAALLSRNVPFHARDRPRTVVPSIYLMHRRPDIYPDLKRFRPERFLEQRAGTYTWIPFGGGIRRCLGAAFAEYETRVALSTLFGSCTVQPTNRRPEPVRRRGIAHTPGRGATVVLG